MTSAPAAAEREEQVAPCRDVEGVDELHPGEQPGERDLDRAQLTDVGRAEDLEDEGGEDAEHGEGEEDLHPLPGLVTGDVGEDHAGDASLRRPRRR